MVELNASVRVTALAHIVWERLVDWERQGEWMVATRVRSLDQQGHGVGGRIDAFTGFGPVGVRDTMTVVAWKPPWNCVVQHTGRVIRGSGTFEISPLPGGHSRLTWSESLDLPFGPLGRAALPIVRPLLRLGLERSVARFAKLVAAENRTAPGAGSR